MSGMSIACWRRVGFVSVGFALTCALDTVAAQESRIDEAALERLVARAKETNSDALVVIENGRVVVDETFGKSARRIEAMSVTKSVVCLAVLRMLELGKIESLDVPVCELFSDWKDDPRREVTIRHLLNHTSGLHANRTTEKIYASDDFVQFALAAELDHPPGEAFFYNNRAVNLLAGVVEKASGQKLDDFLRDELLEPIGIDDVTWTRDKAGNPHAMAGLQILPRDLARIGELMLARGKFGETQWIAAERIDEATKASQSLQSNCGLLWWIIPGWRRAVIDESIFGAWREAGVERQFLERVAPLKDRLLDSDEFFAELEKIFGRDGMEEWHNMTWRAGLPDAKPVFGPPIGYQANGYLGQYLVVLPSAKLVAVRMIRAKSHTGQKDNFGDFTEAVKKLVGS